MTSCIAVTTYTHGSATSQHQWTPKASLHTLTAQQHLSISELLRPPYIHSRLSNISASVLGNSRVVPGWFPGPILTLWVYVCMCVCFALGECTPASVVPARPPVPAQPPAALPYGGGAVGIALSPVPLSPPHLASQHQWTTEASHLKPQQWAPNTTYQLHSKILCGHQTGKRRTPHIHSLTHSQGQHELPAIISRNFWSSQALHR